MDKYSLSEFTANVIFYLKTKLFFKDCRFIRFPFYLRGKKSLVGAKKLTLGRFCRFELNGDKPTLFIGQHCEMGDMTHIVALSHVEIGDNVLVASKCFISDTNHGNYKGEQQDSPYIPPNERKLYSDKVYIGDNVWIGENVVILAGTTIESGCIVGANSVVSGYVSKNSIVVGAPAKVIKKFDDDKKAWVKYEEHICN